MAAFDEENFIVCNICSAHNRRQRINCSDCNGFLGFPNSNIISTPLELEALEKRYELAVQYIESNSLQTVGAILEKELLQNAKVVINVRFRFLLVWILKSSSNYANYYKLLSEGKRDFTDIENETKRSLADSWLFASYDVYKNISYAALSPNNDGLLNYGRYTVALKEDLIKNRTTFLEENSWTFCKKYLSHSTPPKGYRALWNDKHKLGIVKLHKELKLGNTKDEIDSLILHSGVTRHDDEFIEAFIYGSLGNSTIEVVTGSGKELETDAIDGLAGLEKKKALLDVKRLKRKLGVNWIERK